MKTRVWGSVPCIVLALQLAACSDDGNDSFRPIINNRGPDSDLPTGTPGDDTNGSTGGSGSTGDGIWGGGSGDGDPGNGGEGCRNLQCQQVLCEQGTTTVSGRVFEPAGQVPLYNVIVYVPNAPLEPLAEGSSCDRCGAAVTAVTSTITGVDGTFTLENVPVGDQIPIVMQVGKWRRQVLMPVSACEDNVLAQELSRLPRNQNEGNLPQIAVSTGGADSLECFLRKVGISDWEFTRPDETGRVHVYQGYGHNNQPNGSALAGGSPRSIELWSSVETLKRYDLVVLSCEGRANLIAEQKPAQSFQALADYLDDGGRVFASHWHYVWFENGPGMLPDVAEWTRVRNSSSSPFNINTSFPKGADFADWLVHVDASDAHGQIDLDDVRETVGDVDDFMSLPWIYKDDPHAVKYFSFNTPAGDHPESQCGRAVVTDIHISGNDTSGGVFPDNCQTTGLSAQEKALLFLLFDLTACVQDETRPPEPPPVIDGPT